MATEEEKAADREAERAQETARKQYELDEEARRTAARDQQRIDEANRMRNERRGKK